MTKVVSVRISAALGRAVRGHAADSNMPVANLVRWIMACALGGRFNFSVLPDIPQALDDKLDVRLPAELVTRIHAESERLKTSISVYSRIILFAYYTARLIAVEIGGVTRLEENHEQEKSA